MFDDTKFQLTDNVEMFDREYNVYNEDGDYCGDADRKVKGNDGVWYPGYIFEGELYAVADNGDLLSMDFATLK